MKSKGVCILQEIQHEFVYCKKCLMPAVCLCVDSTLQGMAFGWEFVMTFLLVAVVYAVAIGKPSFTETGPLAVGFALWCSAFVGGFTASL